MGKKRKQGMHKKVTELTKHLVLIVASVIALFPVLLIIMNSFKSRNAIFMDPYHLPSKETFNLDGYITVFERSDFIKYYFNSTVVMLVSLVFILLLSSLASYAIGTYKFKGSIFLTVYFVIGIIVPIRLGTVGVLKAMSGLHLTNTLWALILMYIVAGIPQTLFILTQFYRDIPASIREAAKIDGATEFQIYRLCTHLVKPALAATGILSLAPIWNDIWWPLILASGKDVMTVTLGAQQFLGQFSTNWNALLSALTIAMLPLVVLYLIFSKYVISGLVDGAIKG